MVYLLNEYGEPVAELEKTSTGFYRITEKGLEDLRNTLFAEDSTLSVGREEHNWSPPQKG